MRSEIFISRIIAYSILLTFTIRCTNVSNSDSKQEKLREPNRKLNNRVITSVTSDRYQMLISSEISHDTLDVVDYNEDQYSSPIVLDQSIKFYENGQLIKQAALPIKKVTKLAIKKNKVQVLQTPIYQLCTIRTGDNNYFIAYGSDYCNGSQCPEFIGIYSMSGAIIYEGIPNVSRESKLKKVLEEYKIQINNHTKCSRVAL